MLLPLSILVMEIITTAVAQANGFNSPPPGGSGQPTVTYVVGSTYPVTWSTTYTHLDLFLQSHGSQSDGNPLQSFNFSSANGFSITSPFSFDVGTNIDLSLSPFHFELFSYTSGHYFVSDDFNIVAAGSEPTVTAAAPSAQPTTVMVSNPPDTVVVVSYQPSTVVVSNTVSQGTTVTVAAPQTSSVAPTVVTATTTTVSTTTVSTTTVSTTTVSSPTQNVVPVIATGGQAAATSVLAAQAGTGASISPGFGQSVVFGVVMALGCIWGYVV